MSLKARPAYPVHIFAVVIWSGTAPMGTDYAAAKTCQFSQTVLMNETEGHC